MKLNLGCGTRKLDGDWVNVDKMLFDKNDPLDKQILEQHKKKELDITVVELKDPEV
jgi:hypothetical protein